MGTIGTMGTMGTMAEVSELFGIRILFEYLRPNTSIRIRIRVTL